MPSIKDNFDKIIFALRNVLGSNHPIYKEEIRPGPKHNFSDLEVLALSLTADYRGITSENHLFKMLESADNNGFKNLLSRRQYNFRRKKMLPLIEKIRKQIADELNKDQGVFIIDSTPLRLCRKSRMYRNKIGVDQDDLSPDIGYCDAQEEKYFGYKLHVITSSEGVVHQTDITKASVHDLNYLRMYDTNLRDCVLIGDKGYVSEAVRNDLNNNFNIDLVVPSRKNQKVQSIIPKWVFKVRKRIETLFSQLNDQFFLQRHYAKSFAGYITRLQSKICSVTVLQYVNSKLTNNPIGHLKYALNKFRLKI